MPKIITTIPDESQIRQFKRMGFTDFNLHLIDKKITPQRIKQIISNTGIKVRSVHVPNSNTSDVLIECINQNNAIPYTISIAELLSQDDPIYVVCHTQMGKTAADNPEILYSIVKSIDKSLANHPNIILSIENTMIYNSNIKSISQGALPDYTDVVKSIRNLSAYPNQIVSVLDLCHAQSTIYTIKKLFPDWPLKIENYFKANEDICGMIHLANSFNHGYSEYHHGVGFNPNFPDELDRLKTYIKFYNNYVPNALFVYEISETNYEEKKELHNTIDSMKKLGMDIF